MALFFRQKCECECDQLSGPCDDCDCVCPTGPVYIEISDCDEYCFDWDYGPDFPDETGCQKMDYSGANGSYVVNPTGDCEYSEDVAELSIGTYKTIICFGFSEEPCTYAVGQCPCDLN